MSLNNCIKMVRLPKKQKELTTEETILQVAERLFLDKGFALTSTTEIAREAGCNQALVHYYFRTKDQLFTTIFKAKITAFANKFFAIYDQGISFEEKIMQIVDAHFDVLTDNPRLPNLILNVVTSDPQRMKGMRDSLGPLAVKMFGKLSEDLRAEVAAGHVRPMEPMELIFDILSLDIFPFVAGGMVRMVWGVDEKGYKDFVNKRRQSVKAVLLNSIRP